MILSWPRATKSWLLKVYFFGWFKNALQKKTEFFFSDKTPSPGAELNSVLQQCAKALVQEALDRHSLDNITVMIIEL